MTKREARALGRARREGLSAGERAAKDGQIRERLFALPEWRDASCVLLYLSFGTEVDTWEIAARALREGRALYCPRIVDEAARRMVFYRTDPARTETNRRGIREPAANEAAREPAAFDAARTLLLMPGLLFSESGERVGYGGGYYDRYLTGRPDLMNRVALCYDCQVMVRKEPGAGSFPFGETDERIGRIVTETRTIACG